MIGNVTGLSREGGMKYRSVSAFWNSKEGNTWINKCEYGKKTNFINIIHHVHKKDPKPICTTGIFVTSFLS